MKSFLVNPSQRVYVLIASVAFILIGVFLMIRGQNNNPFDGKRAFGLIETQLSFGPRIPGSTAHEQFIQWAGNELTQNGWLVEYQQGVMGGHPLTNILGKKGTGDKVIILSAHYDSRIIADEDVQYPQVQQPVPGADDGASGVAVLLELSRVLKIPANAQIWIVLFDIEDNGKIPGWDWVLGSQYFADHLEITPSALLNLDMIGDKDLAIYKERSSSVELNDQIWKVAGQLGYSKEFISKYAYSILDDHTPFLRKGIKAVDIIDMDYAAHHTLQDDISNISARSLQIIGDVVKKWIEQ